MALNMVDNGELSLRAARRFCYGQIGYYSAIMLVRKLVMKVAKIRI